MLTQEQIDTYNQYGYVKVEGLFTPEEVDELGSEMIKIIGDWGEETIGWRGPWREKYLAEDEQQATKAVLMHNPHFYSATWGRVMFNEKLVGCVQDLIGSSVQWHHTVLHAKPPERGTPFPMHQDYPFYPHDGLDFVDCLLHLDDTPLESGSLCVVPGSHKDGGLEHIMGPDTAPHLPTDVYHPDKVESIPIPAKAGDVIFFSYCIIHWSNVNRTDKWRRSVRFGYHDSAMRPVGRYDDDPYRIDPNNILEGNTNTIVSGYKTNQDAN